MARALQVTAGASMGMEKHQLVEETSQQGIGQGYSLAGGVVMGREGATHKRQQVSRGPV